MFLSTSFSQLKLITLRNVLGTAIFIQSLEIFSASFSQLKLTILQNVLGTAIFIQSLEMKYDPVKHTSGSCRY